MNDLLNGARRRQRTPPSAARAEILVPPKLPRLRRENPAEALRIQSEFREQFQNWIAKGYAATAIEISRRRRQIYPRAVERIPGRHAHNMKIQRVTLREIQMPLLQPFETSFGSVQTRRILLVEAEVDGVSGLGRMHGRRKSFLLPGNGRDRRATFFAISFGRS